MRDPRSTGRSLRARPGRADLARHAHQREAAEPAREVGAARRPPHVVLLGASTDDPAEHLDERANNVEREPLASQVPDADRIGSLLLAKLNVSRDRPD